MIEAVKVALDPTPRQARMLLSHAGAARFAYNAGLAHVKGQLEAKERPDLSHYALRRWWNASKDVLAPWWAENSKEAYSYGLECLSRALRSFLDSKRGKRKGKAVGFPKFKSKASSTPKFAYTTGSFGLIDGDPKALRLPRIGRVHCMEDVARRVGGAHVTRMTVSCHAGRWFASLTVERADVTSSQPKGPAVGVDLGVSHLATLSDGTVVENPKHYQKSLRRLRKGPARPLAQAEGVGASRQGEAPRPAHPGPRRQPAPRQPREAHDPPCQELLGNLNRGPQRRGNGGKPQPRPGRRGRLVRRVPPRARVQVRTHGHHLARHRPLVPKQQDMLGMRGSESQAAPLRAHVPL
jgi:hypothetical protein